MQTRPGRLRLFASCPLGLEELVRDELGQLGASELQLGRGGVHFRGDQRLAYRCCLYSLLASRVLWTLGQFDASDADSLYRSVVDLAWERYLTTDMSLAVDFIGQSDTFRNSLYGARRVKDAIVDRMRAICGSRPDVDTSAPDIRIVARLQGKRLSIALDLAGSPLHQRGYRQQGWTAPLKETLAAALLVRAGWPKLLGSGLYDPVCGSGTLLIEAALIAGDRAPGLSRRFAFEVWPGFDADLWQTLREEAIARAEAGLARIPPIAGADNDHRVIEIARAGIERAGLVGYIDVACTEVESQRRPAALASESGLFIANPPYGERLGDADELAPLYRHLGELWRQQFAGWRIALFSLNQDLLRAANLPRGREYRLRNGALDCRLRVAESRVETRHAQLGSQTAERPAHVDTLVPPSGRGSTMLANRLRKNRRRLKSWLAGAATDCYRLYDADMPEFAVAIDIYGDQAQVSEYAAPSSVEPARAAARFEEIRATLPAVLELPAKHIVYKRRERQRGRSQYQRIARDENEFSVLEAPARLLVNLHDYLDNGLFLDHRPVRRLIGEMASERRFLNLFCYTCAATVHAALGGATASLSVDLSPGYLAWARRNLELNEVDSGEHQLLRADCLDWMGGHDQRYGLILLDPPTFSNSKRMDGSLDLQRDHVGLIHQAARLLESDGYLLFSTNRRRFKLDREGLAGLQIEDISARSWDADFARTRIAHSCYLIRGLR